MVARTAATKKPVAAAKKGAVKVKKDIKKDTATKTKNTVDKDFTVDEETRYSGQCVFFDRKRGFGFIKLDDEGVVPEDKVMCLWKSIQSNDRWPFLNKELKVELSLKKMKDGKDFVVRAMEVTAPGGDKLNLQEELEDKKEYVGDKNMRFLGNVKFYDWQKGFGYVKLQEGYAIDADVPNEFRVDRTEINSGEEAPRLGNDMEIEFGIQKNAKGVYSCYNVTLPGGEVLSRAIAEGRGDVSKGTYKGSIAFWDFRKGMGFIVPEKPASFPKDLKEAFNADVEKRKKKAEKNGKSVDEAGSIFFRRMDLAEQGARFSKGDAVSFKLYTDTQGIGACEVKAQA